MEVGEIVNFNIVNLDNEFKMGEVITVFKIDDVSKKMALYSANSYETDECKVFVGYLEEDQNGYNYISHIDNESILERARKAANDILNSVLV